LESDEANSTGSENPVLQLCIHGCPILALKWKKADLLNGIKVCEPCFSPLLVFSMGYPQARKGIK
jgi:hypothetical protein